MIGKSQHQGNQSGCKYNGRKNNATMFFFLIVTVDKNHDSLYLLLSLYAKLLFQLVGPYASILQELLTIRGEITNVTSELVTFTQQMNSTDLIFGKITMLLDLLKHRSVSLSQKVDD